MDTTEPPIIVSNIKNKENFKSVAWTIIPDVDSDDVIARIILAILRFGDIKKRQNKISKKIIIAKWMSSWWFNKVNFFVKILKNR